MFFSPTKSEANSRKFKLLAWKCRCWNTNLCRKKTIYSLCLRKPQSSISFLCVLSRVLLPLSPGECSAVAEGRRGWGSGQSLSPGLSLPLPTPLSSTPLRSPKKMLLFLLMLQQRHPSFSFRANSWAPHLGTSVLCIDRYATASDSNVEGSGPKAEFWGDITTYPHFVTLSHFENTGKGKWTQCSLIITPQQRNLC